MDEELEGLAAWAHGEIGGAGPIDAFDLLDALDVPLVYEPGSGGRRAGGRIYVGTNVGRRLHSVIAHECAHEMLARFGPANTERNARRLAAMLLVPRRVLDRQLRAGWDLHGLMAFHVNASAELLARRITEIRAARLAIYDAGRLRYRIGGPLREERALVDEALATERPVRVDDLTGAWPMLSGHWRRVLVLGAA